MKRLLAVWSVVVAVVVTTAAVAVGAEGAVELKDAELARALAQRYGYQVDLKRYPQGNPQETIGSIVKATAAGDVGYMVAHLISPQETDRKFRGDPEKFRRLTVKATPEKSAQMVNSLKRHLDDGVWTVWRNRAWSHVDGTLGLSLENAGKRWFMHNTPQKVPVRRVAGMPPTVDRAGKR